MAAKATQASQDEEAASMVWPADKPPAKPLRPPSWLAPVALLIIGLALADTVYLTIAHYTETAHLACPETGVINCAKVTTSSFASIMGIPVALLGLIFFAANLPLHLPIAWKSPHANLRRLRLLLSASGVIMVFWLIYVELFKLNAICLYCTASHILAVLLFIATALGTALTAEHRTSG